MPDSLGISTDYKLQQKLKSKLRKARLYLDDAENRQLGDKGIKEWLDHFKHLVFQADDLSEEICDSQNGKSLITSLKPKNQSLAETVRGELEEILMELDGLLDRVSTLRLKCCDGTPRDEGSSSTANPAPLLAQHHVFGRNGDKDVILDLLLSDKAFGNQKIGVVPIVGMGGIGKTTLAHLVYHDSTRLTEDEFKPKAWVNVSTDFNLVTILNSILQQINPGSVDTGDLSQLQQKMKNALTGKKFLIVLDDVWDDSYNNWDLLKSNFEWGALGSRVVVTTRSEEVGKTVTTGPIHKPREVSREDGWRIFIDHAFSAGDSNSYPLLNEVGRKIVEKCNGLPLAMKALGGLLRWERDPTKWENVLKSNVWECCKNNQSNGVLPSLWLSYRYLPSSLKQCFSYCSVFPQNYKFNKKKMVLLWMAEGFLTSDEKGNRSMEETGEKYFDDLVSRSLFQRSGGDESKFVMHDLVHDMAAFVSGEFCASVAKEDVELKRVSIQTRHLSLCNVSYDSKFSIDLSKAKHLRSFHTEWEYGEFCDDEFVKKLITNHRRLRALSIRTTDPILASLCNLKHLRFLNLSAGEFTQVPSSVCTLVNLQTLILSGCSRLTQLPTGITKLVKLRHLDISHSELIKDMPTYMGSLEHLQYLNLSGCKFEEVPSSVCTLFNLQTLILSRCSRLTKLPTDITKLIKLRHLDISLSELIKDMPTYMGSLEHLQYLNLSGCKFEEVPSSVCTLFNLQALILSRCSRLTQLPIDITKLIKLRHLDISGSWSITHMPPHMGNLKELRTLTHFIVGDPGLSDCSNIKEMQELQHLSGKLSISGLENAAKFKDVGKDILRHKANLKELVLEWDDTSIGRREDKEVLDALQLHTNLERLVIEGYQALSFPTWVCEMSSEKLVSMELHGDFCDSLPPLGQLPSLLKLVIKGFAKVEKIGLEFYSNDSSTTPFRCLETLVLLCMASLKEWVFVDKAFPCLKDLKLDNCPELEPLLGLPESLTHLEIMSCSKLVAPDSGLDLQNLPALVSFLIRECKCESAATPSPSELFAQVFLPSSLASLELYGLWGFKSINGSAFQQAKSLTTLRIQGCHELESLPEEELPKSLSTLEIGNCPLLEKKYSKSKGDESYQHISHIPNIIIGGPTYFSYGMDFEEAVKDLPPYLNMDPDVGCPLQ